MSDEDKIFGLKRQADKLHSSAAFGSKKTRNMKREKGLILPHPLTPSPNGKPVQLDRTTWTPLTAKKKKGNMIKKMCEERVSDLPQHPTTQNRKS